jgi:hypothetical protein
MIKVNWRLGEVERFKVSAVSPSDDIMRENWYGVDAATGLTIDSFEAQMDRIEHHIVGMSERRDRKIELYIRFTIEISGK